MIGEKIVANSYSLLNSIEYAFENQSWNDFQGTPLTGFIAGYCLC